MEAKLKKILLSNISLKVYALCVGYSVWCCLGGLYPIIHTFKVPLCFYGATEQYHIKGPESLIIKVQAYKNDFYALDRTNLAFHINCDDLSLGKNIIPATHKHLFLPHQYKLVHCNPAQIIITKDNTNNKTIC